MAGISNFEIIDKELIYDAIIVPVFKTANSDEKREEAGLIKEPMDNESSNIVETALTIEE